MAQLGVFAERQLPRASNGAAARSPPSTNGAAPTGATETAFLGGSSQAACRVAHEGRCGDSARDVRALVRTMVLGLKVRVLEGMQVVCADYSGA